MNNKTSILSLLTLACLLPLQLEAGSSAKTLETPPVLEHTVSIHLGAGLSDRGLGGVRTDLENKGVTFSLSLHS